MFQCKLDMYFYLTILYFCLYLNISCRGILEKKKIQSKQVQPLKQQYRYRKQIKQFENHQKSGPILQVMFQCKLDMYFYLTILYFCLYLNISCRGILEQKKNLVQTGVYPLLLSLLKHRLQGYFGTKKKKKSGPNRCNLLNNSIDIENR